MPPLESLKALLTLFVSHNHEEAKGKRTLAATSAVHTSMECHCDKYSWNPPDEEIERLARESGPGYVGLLRKCTCARWQAHYAQILKGHGFAQGLSNPALFVRFERDVRLLVHGDDFMVRNTMESAQGSSIQMGTLRWKLRSEPFDGSGIFLSSCLTSATSPTNFSLFFPFHFLQIMYCLVCFSPSTLDWHYGVKCEIHMRCDSIAAKNACPVRQGLDKTQQEDVRFLWPQQAVLDRRLKVQSVPESVRHFHEIPVPS